MTRASRWLCWMAVVLIVPAPARAQGRGGSAWTTVGGDAQRTAAVRTDQKISLASMQKPGFQFLWKRKLDAGALSQPLLLPNIIAYKGFKALAFVASTSGGVYSIDYDLNRMFWEQKLRPVAGSGACPARPPAITRVTPSGAPAAPGRGGGGRGRGAGLPQIANGRGGNDNLFAIAGDGMVHVMNPQIGTDQMPPVKFLSPNANVVGSVLVDNVLYAATTGNCGATVAGVWAVDLLSDGKTVTSFDAKGAAIVGTAAPTFGTSGAIYVATGAGSSPVANAVVALEPKSLVQKELFTAAAPFTTHPVVFQHKGKDLVVAANKDGKLYLLDSASIGGADHKTPLATSPPVSSGAGQIAGLSTWIDGSNTRWIVASISGAIAPATRFAMNNGSVTNGALAAFTVVDQNDVPSLQPQWVSRDLASPAAPVVVNGVVFALATGGAGQRAALYALDGATGKELWTSGSTITSAAQPVGPSAGDSQVYVVTRDGTLYAFGMPAER